MACTPFTKKSAKADSPALTIPLIAFALVALADIINYGLFIVLASKHLELRTLKPSRTVSIDIQRFVLHLQ